MTQTFFIGDTHFGHKNIIKFENPHRPFLTIEEHDEELVKRWNSVVGKNDIVWVVGDFCFGKEKLAIADRLNGSKRLVMGNHDMYLTADYLKYFDKLCGAVEYKDCIITHIPVHPNQFDRYLFNIHGHLHSKRVWFDCGDKECCEDFRYINVSAERINLTPISFDQIMKQLSPFYLQRKIIKNFV